MNILPLIKSILTSYKTETIIFTSELSKQEQLANFRERADELRKKGLLDKLFETNNIDIAVFTNEEIEVQLLHQYLTFNGLGMTAKLRGNIVEDGPKSKLQLVFRINILLKTYLFLFPSIALLILFNREWSLLSIIPIILFCIFFISFFLIYFKIHKYFLLKNFMSYFKLKRV